MNIPLEDLEIMQKSINELKKENLELKEENEKIKKDKRQLLHDGITLATKTIKLEKAIEILKNKEVDMKLFFNSLFREQQYKINPLEFYNGSVGYKRLWLTQEEFYLIKEVLKNER